MRGVPLLLLKDSKRRHPSDEELQDLIDRVRADRMLAEIAIDDAVDANGIRILISTARQQLADGDADAASDRRDAAELAIGHYRNAWRLALIALAKLGHPGEWDHRLTGRTSE